MFRKLRYVLRRRYLWVPRPVKKAIVIVIGGTVLLLGVVMMITPGPAFLVIPLGLAILAIEFVWARRWLKRIKKSVSSVKERVMGNGKGTGAVASATANGTSKEKIKPSPSNGSMLPRAVIDIRRPGSCQL